MMRALSAAMVALFALAAAVQYNDPDPLLWMAIYVAAAALSAWVAVRSTVPVLVALTVGLIALVWGLWLGAGVYGRVLPGELVEAWEMKDDRIETAREALGLLLVSAWMLFLAGHSWRARRMTAPRAGHRVRT